MKNHKQKSVKIEKKISIKTVNISKQSVGCLSTHKKHSRKNAFTLVWLQVVHSEIVFRTEKNNCKVPPKPLLCM